MKMKLILWCFMLTFALMLASCEQEPVKYPTLNPEKMVLKVGDKVAVRLVKNDYRTHHVRIHGVYPINNKPAKEFLCQIGDHDDEMFTLYARHSGCDTLVVSYGYTLGIFAHGRNCILPIRVEE